MKQIIFLSLTFLIFIDNSSRAQSQLDGLWAMKQTPYSVPEIFLSFNKDSFEMTDYRKGIEYGKGIWSYKNHSLILNYDSVPYQKSFVKSYCDSPMQKTERLLLTAFVFDGFSKKAAYKPTLTFYDSLNHEIFGIKADTSGKVITTIYHPSSFKKIKVDYFGYYDSLEFDLTNYQGKNLYLQFYVNLAEKNYKPKSTEIYHYELSQTEAKIILKDQTGKEFVFSQYSWKYEL